MIKDLNNIVYKYKTQMNYLDVINEFKSKLSEIKYYENNFLKNKIILQLGVKFCDCENRDKKKANYHVQHYNGIRVY